MTGETVHTCEGFLIRVDPADYAVGHTVARTGSYEPEVSRTLRQLLGQGRHVRRHRGEHRMVQPPGRLPGRPYRPGHRHRTEPPQCGPAEAERQGQQFRQYRHRRRCPRGAPRSRRTGNRRQQRAPDPGRRATCAVRWKQVLSSPPTPSTPFSTRWEPSRVDAIKIDVEGAEPLVIRGATRTHLGEPAFADQRVLPAGAGQLTMGKCPPLPGDATGLRLPDCRSSGTRASTSDEQNPVHGEPARPRATSTYWAGPPEPAHVRL